MPPIAGIVDVGALVGVMVASLVGGLGLTFGFSLVIVTATRAAERRRAGSTVAAVALGALSAVAAAGCLALVAVGIWVMVAT